MENRSLLVWKFFFQQKYREIVDNKFGTFMISYLVCVIFGAIAWIPKETQWWAAYIVFVVIGLWATFFIISILKIIFMWLKELKIIFMWLKENWESANKKADKEVRNIKKGSRKK